MWERTTHGGSRYQSPRPIEVPCTPFASRLREMLQKRRKTIYEISAITGIDAAYIWRIVRGERVEISREVVIKISLALVLDKDRYDEVIPTADFLLDGMGYKMLRGNS